MQTVRVLRSTTASRAQCHVDMFLLTALTLTLCMANRAASDNVFRFQSSKTETRIQKAWVSFKDEYARSYSSVEEEYRRLKIFRENFLEIELHNKLYEQGLESYGMGINQFSDMEDFELMEFTGYLEDKEAYSSDDAVDFSPDDVDLPESVDWRQKKYVTEVKNQGRCGSCWAFSATGALEGQMMRKTGQLVSLSEQNLIDCSQPQGDKGCNGGWVGNAYEYVKTNGGIDLELKYPYKAKEEPCHYEKQYSGGTVSDIVRLPPGDERKLTEAIATVGPIAVSFNAVGSFHKYEKGIYSESNCSKIELNHAVLVVGYGSEKGKDYYIVKNSWGAKWGEKGYIRMARNSENMCGIASQAVYPIV